MVPGMFVQGLKYDRWLGQQENAVKVGRNTCSLKPCGDRRVAGLYEIRADFDRKTIVMYQAYSSRIADPALKEQAFVEPFSFNRMTWIRPSFFGSCTEAIGL